ncbi:MAG: hypothetical protein ACLUI3_04515 [Christensenellales bacterium]
MLIGAFYATIGALAMYVVRFIVSTKGDVKAVAKDTGKVCYNTVINGTNRLLICAAFWPARKSRFPD